MSALRKGSNDQKIKIVALAGNPNVGKSTVFNGLTGLKQHTGNWAGKTVSNAVGYFSGENTSYKIVDIPGTYSLVPHSEEEKVAVDYICFGYYDAVVVVCDATCLERNMNLVLQILEVTNKVILCINLMDEAKKKGIEIDTEKLKTTLKIPVVAITARSKKELKTLISTLDFYCPLEDAFLVKYPQRIEKAINILSEGIYKICQDYRFSRWMSITLLSSKQQKQNELMANITQDSQEVKGVIAKAQNILETENISEEGFNEIVTICSVETAGKICAEAVTEKKLGYSDKDRKIDKILTSKLTAYPIMILMLLLIFWLTIEGANYPSQVLSSLFSRLEGLLRQGLLSISLNQSIVSFLIDGVFHTTSTVVSVMLPPMAIFFPLFTLIEDSGILPRIAYNLDKPFSRCNACGKQALTMCMGFGCNAAGVSGCRIIDSDREKKLAILTNSLVPCNGRFPTIVALITLFFVGGNLFVSSVFSALFLTLVIVIGILATFFLTKILSKTILKGNSSSYILELPSYRRPQILQVIVRSVFDRTLHILGRAVAVAAPAGAVIWLLANLKIGDISLLNRLAELLNPVGTILGFDGAVLLAFILGLPANEIVLPIATMVYSSATNLSGSVGLDKMGEIFINNGWNIKTAVCVILFSLMHWPCSTTLITVKKETGSIKWMILSFLLPTALGIVVCVIVNLISTVFGL